MSKTISTGCGVWADAVFVIFIGSNAEAVKFLQRHGDSGDQVIVRMRGLPYSCTTEQVVCIILSSFLKTVCF